MPVVEIIRMNPLLTKIHAEQDKYRTLTYDENYKFKKTTAHDKYAEIYLKFKTLFFRFTACTLSYTLYHIFYFFLFEKQFGSLYSAD